MKTKMNQKEQWANEVLQSLAGIKRAEPSVDLFVKISKRLPKEKLTKIIPLNRLIWIASAVCIVIALNIYVVRTEMNSTHYSKNNEIELLNNYSIYE